MFWIAGAISLFVGLLAVIVLFMVLSTPRTGTGWVWTIGIFVLSTWIGFVLLSLGLNTARGLERGTLEAEDARSDRYEAHGRRAGKVVGTGLAKVTGRAKTTPTTDAAPNAPTTGSTDSTGSSASESTPTFDDAARSLGKMVGRRLGERKERS